MNWKRPRRTEERRKKVGRNGTGNSLRRENESQQQQQQAEANNQQNTHRVEAHAYMWSILTLISKNFIFTFSQINTFRLNWFNGVYIEQREPAKSSKE